MDATAGQTHRWLPAFSQFGGYRPGAPRALLQCPQMDHAATPGGRGKEEQRANWSMSCPLRP